MRKNESINKKIKIITYNLFTILCAVQNTKILKYTLTYIKIFKFKMHGT